MNQRSSEPLTILQLIHLIEQLPSDPPVDDPRKWYRTQKQHWLGWLKEYEGPGAYGRQTGIRRDARYAYNHIVCPEMLLYLIRALSMPPEIIAQAQAAYQSGDSLMQKSASIRKVVPWTMMQSALLKWIQAHKPESLLQSIFRKQK